MIIVTGGAGFIGSNLIKGLNQRGHNDIIVVDNLTDGRKFTNIVDCDFLDYIDMEDFVERINEDDAFCREISVIFHQGACSTTTQWDGRYLLDVNYEYSKQLLQCAVNFQFPLIYASSAAAYGDSQTFTPNLAAERPLNFYGYSKLLFDRYVDKLLPQAKNQIVGLRYFNVYGPREQHKDGMVSAIRHFHNELMADDTITIFTGFNDCEAGEQQRDFVYIDDVVNLNYWLWQHPQVSGLFNCGSGQANSFNAIAAILIAEHGRGNIVYQEAPEKLKGHYQTYTCANLDSLREAGYQADFHTIEQGIRAYLANLHEARHHQV